MVPWQLGALFAVLVTAVLRCCWLGSREREGGFRVPGGRATAGVGWVTACSSGRRGCTVVRLLTGRGWLGYRRCCVPTG